MVQLLLKGLITTQKEERLKRWRGEKMQPTEIGNEMASCWGCGGWRDTGQLGYCRCQASLSKDSSELSWQDYVGQEPINAAQRMEGERNRESQRLKFLVFMMQSLHITGFPIPFKQNVLISATKDVWNFGLIISSFDYGQLTAITSVPSASHSALLLCIRSGDLRREVMVGKWLHQEPGRGEKLIGLECYVQ